MIIEINSKWVKDGEVVEVAEVCQGTRDTYGRAIVWFITEEDYGVLTYNDFLEQYKPYEVVYEYQYAYMDEYDSAETTVFFYKDDAEFLSVDTTITEYQRLDFTKRERK